VVRRLAGSDSLHLVILVLIIVFLLIILFVILLIVILVVVLPVVAVVACGCFVLPRVSEIRVEQNTSWPCQSPFHECSAQGCNATMRGIASRWDGWLIRTPEVPDAGSEAQLGARLTSYSSSSSRYSSLSSSSFRTAMKEGESAPRRAAPRRGNENEKLLPSWKEARGEGEGCQRNPGGCGEVGHVCVLVLTVLGLLWGHYSGCCRDDGER
jgi:hypothetical protein